MLKGQLVLPTWQPVLQKYNVVKVNIQSLGTNAVNSENECDAEDHYCSLEEVLGEKVPLKCPSALQVLLPLLLLPSIPWWLSAFVRKNGISISIIISIRISISSISKCQSALPVLLQLLLLPSILDGFWLLWGNTHSRIFLVPHLPFIERTNVFFFEHFVATIFIHSKYLLNSLIVTKDFDTSINCTFHLMFHSIDSFQLDPPTAFELEKAGKAVFFSSRLHWHWKEKIVCECYLAPLGIILSFPLRPRKAWGHLEGEDILMEVGKGWRVG